MQRTKTKITTALLLALLTLAVFPLAANASTGFITIQSLTVPSPAVSVPAGGNVNLYFGNVLFSGGQLYLLLSADGFSQVSAGDIRFTPSFALNSVQAPGAAVTVTDPTGTFPGSWIVGSGWINGSIPLNIAGGPYFVKCFDGATTSVAVTDVPFTVTASFTVAPTSGAAGTALTLKGNAFTAGALVNVTYINPFTLPNPTLVTVSNLTQSGNIGNFTLNIPAPDLKQVSAAGVAAQASNGITFTAQDNKTATIYTAVYTEMQRGLLQFGTPKAGAVPANLFNSTDTVVDGIYGNNTSFTSAVPTGFIGQVNVGVGDKVRIIGNWFYPGNMTFKWDNSIDISPADATKTANGTGYFNTTVVVPGTGLGTHNITLVDANGFAFGVFLNVVQSITIDPSSGPIGTTVTVKGFGFPANNVPSGNVYNATIYFRLDLTPTDKAVGWALTDANGAFTTTIIIPTATGGAHLIIATTNDTALTSAQKSFTITSAFTVTPSSFYGNSSNTKVTGSGTGFDPAASFFVAIDNQFSPFTNTTNGILPSADGNLTFSFIGVGFQPGLHIVTVYQAGSGAGANAPIANGTFIVLAEPNADVVGALNQIKASLAAINATVLTINGNTATLSTSIGTITTSISSMQSTVSGLQGTVTSISNNLATVQTTLGSVTTSLSSLDAVLGVVAGDTATLKTSLGDVTTSLASINTKVTSIQGDVATVKTDVGTLSGKVTSIDGNVATIQTDVGTLKADVSTVKSDVSATKSNTDLLSPLVIVAIVIALIAAIAAIASIILVRRKIAG